MEDNKIFLSESEMPQRWYNIQPDLPSPLAPFRLSNLLPLTLFFLQHANPVAFVVHDVHPGAVRRDGDALH